MKKDMRLYWDMSGTAMSQTCPSPLARRVSRTCPRKRPSDDAATGPLAGSSTDTPIHARGPVPRAAGGASTARAKRPLLRSHRSRSKPSDTNRRGQWRPVCRPVLRPIWIPALASPRLHHAPPRPHLHPLQHPLRVGTRSHTAAGAPEPQVVAIRYRKPYTTPL